MRRDKSRRFIRFFPGVAQIIYGKELKINKHRKIQTLSKFNLKRKSFLILSFALMISLPLKLFCTQCPCDKDPLSLQDHANKIAVDNIKQVYRQEFGKEVDGTGDSINALGTQPQLYVFVSLSMPMPGLLDLGKQAKAYGGVLVLRGLVEGSYRKTALKLQSFIEQTKTGMIVDPMLFRQYDIKTTPCVVLSPAPAAHLTTSPTTTSKVFDKVSGFIPIKTALEEIQKKGDMREIASHLLKATSTQGSLS